MLLVSSIFLELSVSIRFWRSAFSFLYFSSRAFKWPSSFQKLTIWFLSQIISPSQSINCDSYNNINFKTKEKFKTLKGKRVNPGTSFGSKLAKYSLLSEQVKGENVNVTTEVEFWSNGNVKEIKVDGSTFRMVGKKYYGEI